jgi:hypothetical protein
VVAVVNGKYFNNMEYVAFSDESYSGARYRSIASFSCLLSKLDKVNAKLRYLLEESDVSEFKWEKLKNAKYRFCADKFVKALWCFLNDADARLDVVIWDTQDSRHLVRDRDDIENQARMFYHLHHQSLKRRSVNSKWCLYPDEKVEMDWDSINKCLSMKGIQSLLVELPLFGTFYNDSYFVINDFKQVLSHNEPCCQLADLFAGLSVFSLIHYEKYNKWLSQNHSTLSFWEDESIDLTNSEYYRFDLLSMFDNGCKKRKLGVSLKNKKCLFTHNPVNPINFWHYKPQHENDKAPTKGLQ